MAAITGYSTLQTAVTDWLARSDLSSFTENFIQNAESNIYKTLRVREMETALSATVGAGTAAVPADYLGLKYAYINGSPVQWLDVETPEAVYKRYPNRSSGGKPLFIAREGSNFIFGPSPDSGYTLNGIYYAKPAALRTTTTNSVLTNHPNVFLYGALVEAAPFIGDDPRLQTWQIMYKSAMDNLKRDAMLESHSGGSLQVRAG